MPNVTETHSGEMGSSTINHYYPPPTKSWRESATLVTLTLNIIALFAVAFGGMKWVTEVNVNIERLTTRQEINMAAVERIQNFNVEVIKRHAIEDVTSAMKLEKTK
jgi:hypothetical protein